MNSGGEKNLLDFQYNKLLKIGRTKRYIHFFLSEQLKLNSVNNFFASLKKNRELIYSKYRCL